MSTPKIQNGIKPTDIIASAILFILLSFGSIHLWDTKLQSEVTLVALLSSSGLFSLIILFHRRIKKAGPSGLELYKKIEKKEASMKKLASAVLDVFESKDHGLMLGSYERERYEQSRQELKKLID